MDFLQNELPFLSNNPLLVEDIILSFDKQAHFPNLFLPVLFVIKKRNSAKVNK
jgi:hypothetical protein